MMMARPRLIKTTTPFVTGRQADDKNDDVWCEDGDNDDGEGFSRCHHRYYACHVKVFDNNTITSMTTIFSESRV